MQRIIMFLYLLLTTNILWASDEIVRVICEYRHLEYAFVTDCAEYKLNGYFLRLKKQPNPEHLKFSESIYKVTLDTLVNDILHTVGEDLFEPELIPSGNAGSSYLDNLNSRGGFLSSFHESATALIIFTHKRNIAIYPNIKNPTQYFMIYKGKKYEIPSSVCEKLISYFSPHYVFR